MDQALIEQITKLVITKLAEKSKPYSLSNEEIERWNQITASFLGVKVAGSSFKEYETPFALSNEEIKRWNRITASMNGTMPEARSEEDQVRFYKYIN